MKTHPQHSLKQFGLLLLTVAMVVPAFAGAQSVTKVNVEPRGDFVLEPGKTEVFLEPGETETKQVSIVNRSQETVTFSISVEDLAGSEDPEQTVVLLGDQRGPYSLRDYVSMPISEFTLGFGEKITIPVTVSIPEDAEPGGHYGAILVSNAPSKLDEGQEGQAQTTVVSRLGSIFLVRVAGDVTEEGSLEDFRIAGGKKLFFEGGPEKFEVLFRNSGNVHLTPYGQIEVKNLFGSTVGIAPVDAYFALPESLRYRQVEWSSGVLFGRYTANLSLWWGEEEHTDSMQISFWVIPWKLILIALGAIVVLSLLIYFVMSRFEIKRK